MWFIQNRQQQQSLRTFLLSAANTFFMGGSFRTQVLNSYLRIVTQWCLENILSFIEKYIHFAAAFYRLLESRVLSKKSKENFLATITIHGIVLHLSTYMGIVWNCKDDFFFSQIKLNIVRVFFDQTLPIVRFLDVNYVTCINSCIPIPNKY